MRYFPATLFSVFYFLFFIPFAGATEFTSTNFRILDPVLQAVSSTEMSSTNFRLLGTVGQIAVGTSTATNFALSSGFLFYPFVSEPTVTAFAGNEGVGLHWTAASGLLGWTVSGYNIGRSTTSGGPYTYSSVGSTTATMQTGLTTGTTYYFVVRPEDVFGNPIATSTEVSATPTANVTSFISGSLDTKTASSTVFATSAGPKVELTIPADVLTSGIKLNTEFLARPESVATNGKSLPSGKLAANTFYSFTFKRASDLTEITSLDKSITLTFTYTDSDISGIDESTLEVRRWNGSSWAQVSGASVDTSTNTVTVSTAQFSDFGLLGSAPSSGGGDTTTTSTGGGGGIIETLLIIIGRSVPPRFVTAPYPQITDLNGDGTVNLRDLSILLAFTLKPAPNPADFNADQRIDTKDISILLSNWTEKPLAFLRDKPPQRAEERREVSAREGGFAFVGTQIPPDRIKISGSGLKDSGETVRKTITSVGALAVGFISDFIYKVYSSIKNSFIRILENIRVLTSYK